MTTIKANEAEFKTQFISWFNEFISHANYFTAVQKEVNAYERYLRNLKGKIFEAFYRRTLDHRQADILTNTIFEEHSIPDI